MVARPEVGDYSRAQCVHKRAPRLEADGVRNCMVGTVPCRQRGALARGLEGLRCGCLCGPLPGPP